MSQGHSETINRRPEIGPYSAHFHDYIKLVEEDDIRTALKNQTPETEKFFNSITEEKSLYKYAEGKWTIKEALQHIIDAERVFTYRAMAFARKDKNHLPSFDENSYAANSHANSRSWKDLKEEFSAVRKSTEMLFNSFTDEDLKTTGIASDAEISVMALGFTIAGHAAHHVTIIRERYLGD
jgi:hypothetical protein